MGTTNSKKKTTAAKSPAANKPAAKSHAKVKTLKPAASTEDDKKGQSGSSPVQTGSSPGQSGSSPGTGSSPAGGSSPAETGSSPALQSNLNLSYIGGTSSHSLGSAIASTFPCVVIPYRKEPAAGEELKYALRAWAKNLPDCNIVIIGDREDWFSSAVDHIPTDPSSKNPQIDVAGKLMIAISDSLIPEDFIWSNDDIYPMTPILPADLELLTCNGPLPVSKPRVNGIYAENKQRTVDALRKEGLPIWDYSTHTPFVFNKEQLAAVIERFGADQEGHLVSSLYFNSLYPEVVPVKIDPREATNYMCCVHRADPDPATLKQALTSLKFININNEGYKAVLPHFKNIFSEKSRFEV